MGTQTMAPGTALITGAAKRIGKAIALHLAALGCNIALHYNQSKREAEATLKEIKKLGANAALFACDLTDEGGAAKLISDVTQNFQDLNILINNASIFEPSAVKEGNTNTLRNHLCVNLEAPFILTAHFAKHCAQGHIINILDTHLAHGRTKHAAYLLSKKALHGLTQISAAEFAPGIQVNAVAPGLILPPEGKAGDYLERLAQDIPMKRIGDASQVCHAIEFLLGNKYITGETIFVDGGEHLT